MSTKTTQAAVLAAAHVYSPAAITIPLLVRDTGMSYQTIERALEALGYVHLGKSRPQRWHKPEPMWDVPFTVGQPEPVVYEQLSNGFTGELTPENSILVRYIPVSAHDATALLRQNREKIIDYLRNPTREDLEKVAVTLVSLAKNWEDSEEKV